MKNSISSINIVTVYFVQYKSNENFECQRNPKNCDMPLSSAGEQTVRRHRVRQVVATRTPDSDLGERQNQTIHAFLSRIEHSAQLVQQFY